MDKETDLKFGT